MARPRRSYQQWLRDDHKKAIGFRGAARVIRQHPRLLWRFALYLVVTYGLLVLVLALVGELSAFDGWMGLPIGLSVGVFLRDLHVQRESDRDEEARLPSDS
jgi:hypothetical protein